MAGAPKAWSRLIRFVSDSGEILLGEPTDPEVDVGLAVAKGRTVDAFVLEGRVPWQAGSRTGKVERVAKLLSPVARDMIDSIRATGLNYMDHAAEMNLPLPSSPVVFTKPRNTLADPVSEIPIPKIAQNEQMDYEVELAIVLSKQTKDVTEADALDHVLGYTCANDLTARKQQAMSSQWTYSKSFDNFCPLGPCIVNASSITDVTQLNLRTTLNGQIMQQGSTSKAIFTIAQIVSYISQGTTLEAGTVIITGTPPGIGDGRNPKIWLKDGDVVKCSIDHGIGTLVNVIHYD